MRILDDFVCLDCEHRDEYLHEQGSDTLPCPVCGGGRGMRRVIPRLQRVENFGALGVHHTPGRRLSKAEAERREWYKQTRHKEANPQSMAPRPKVFG